MVIFNVFTKFSMNLAIGTFYLNVKAEDFSIKFLGSISIGWNVIFNHQSSIFSG